jgi:regulator of protease activity HflC (stomatin/prohibitin superfamily)
MSQENESHKMYAKPGGEHVSLGRTLRGFLFWIAFAPALFILYRMYDRGKIEPVPAVVIAVVIGIVWHFIISGVRVAAQWERGVILRLGSFKKVKGPGLMYVKPIFEYVRFIDIRTLVLNIPRQKVITKDNVPAEIDGAVFFMVKNPEKALTSIQDFLFAMSQYAQATLREVVGGLSLDELLSERERIQTQISKNVEEQVKDWGLHIDSIQLQDIELPEELKKMMSRQASAEREKRATITKAEGDKLAAVTLAEAADLLEKNSIALQLRPLQSIDALGENPANTVILFPAEFIKLMNNLPENR